MQHKHPFYMLSGIKTNKKYSVVGNLTGQELKSKPVDNICLLKKSYIKEA